jgi:hypothetical protein
MAEMEEMKKPAASVSPGGNGRIGVGLTFSHTHIEHLGFPVDGALREAISLGCERIRLGVYWNRIEPRPGQYTFTEPFRLLDLCEREKQSVVLTVGMKAPRWPEFYWPDYAAIRNSADPQVWESVLAVVERTVTALRAYGCITHWQVENEPLDPSGPEEKTVPAALLEREIALVRRLDARPVVVNVWGNDAASRGLYKSVAAMADVVGVDLYYRQFMRDLLGRPVYAGPRQPDRVLAEMLRSGGKPVWVSELQAEPWEKDETGYLSDTTGSISPDLLVQNFRRAALLPVTEIHLWGFEYWLWRSRHGDPRYMDAVRRILHDRQSGA